MVLQQKKARRTLYPAQTNTDADYADDIALLANTLTQAESLLHSLEQRAGGICLHVNTDKTEFMCFNQKKMHLPTKCWFSETSGQVHVPWKREHTDVGRPAKTYIHQLNTKSSSSLDYLATV